MSMAAACLSTPEAVGLAACVGKSNVGEKNKGYLKLCNFLNLPTLKDLAIANARSLLHQWAEYEPNLVTTSGHDITSVNAGKNTLLSDLFELAKCELNAWYPEYQADKKKKTPGPQMPCESTPGVDSSMARGCRKYTKSLWLLFPSGPGNQRLYEHVLVTQPISL